MPARALRSSSVLAAVAVLAVPLAVPPAAAQDVGPFSYVGWEGVVERDGETSGVALYDRDGGLELSHGGRNGVSLTEVGFEPAWGWSTGGERSGAAGPLTDEGVDVSSDWNPRGVYAVEATDPGRLLWASGFPGEVRSHSAPYVVASSSTGEWRLLAVGSDRSRPVAAGATLLEDLLVEPQVGAEGTTSLHARPLSASGDPSAAAGESSVLAGLGVCPDLQYLVNDAWWLVHRCGSGPVEARDLLEEGASGVVLDLAVPGLSLRPGEFAEALLADGYLAYASGGDLRLVDLADGHDGSVLALRGEAVHPSSYELSVPRSGWALAAVEAGTEGQALLLTLSEGHRDAAAADPFEQWYAARSSAPPGAPVEDPVQVAKGALLPAADGVVVAWDDGTRRRVHEVHGDIGRRYDALGGPDGSAVGYPLTDELGVPRRPGAYNHFEHGSVYWSPGTGAHEVRGAIRGRWAGFGWEQSFLGFPTTDEVPVDGGAMNDFQGGSLVWSPAAGVREVHGAVRSRWQALGGPRSALGLPVTDELGTPGRPGAYNHFQHGSVYWSPGTGAHEVRGAIRAVWAHQGWEAGLGFPLTDELGTPGRPGAYNHFERGSVYWSPATGAVSVRGAFRDAWAQQGWEAGRLGFPVTEQERLGSAVVTQRFQGGSVFVTDGRVSVSYR